MRSITLPLVVCLAALAGCQTTGTGSLPRDRIGYSRALGDSWKEQMLLNIVKLRYLDPPVHLDVSSVISTYEVEARLDLASTVLPHAQADNSRRLGIGASYTDRPTISYTPLTGEKFINSLLRPIAPQTIFAMIESGHAAEVILRTTVRAVNGIYGHSGSTGRARAPDPRFAAVIEALRRIEQAGALSVRTERHDGRSAAFVTFARGAGVASDAAIDLLRRTLGLDPQADEVALVFGARNRGAREIALLTRSMQEILAELSAGVDVPPEDLAEGRATRRPAQAPVGPGDAPLMRVHSGGLRDANAYAAVRYRDLWFWIDDRDLASKRSFMFLTTFWALAETGTVPQAPLITIPAR